MTDDELDAIAARADAAMGAPWTADERDLADPWAVSATVRGMKLGYGWDRPGPVAVGFQISKADAIFIAHARTDVPALVAEVRRLREALGAVDA